MLELENRIHGPQHDITFAFDIFWPMITATPAQRCEAYLRTIGKWVEE